jgi:magnesium and cobalt exporter, CNNM family
MSLEIIVVTFVVFLWLLTAWDALVQLSGGRIRRIEMENRALADQLESWKDQEEDYIVVFKILVFLLLALLAVSAYGAIFRFYPDISSNMALLAVLGVIFVLTLASIVVAEFCHGKLDIMLLRLAMPLIKLLAKTVFWPLVFLFHLIERGVRELGDSDAAVDTTTAEDEIMSLVEQDDDDGEHGTLEEDEKRMIRGIFDLNDTPVREIMTPRVDMTALSSDTSIKDAKKEFIESGHSRIPIYDSTIDEIKGIVYAKDFLDDEKITGLLSNLAHKPTFIPETKNVGDLLEEFKKGSIHAAIIIDEYGGTSGIVSLEDILEEIVGEIRDEYDSEEEAETGLVELDNGTLAVDARYLIGDLNEEYELDLPEDEDVDTIGGYICGEFGRIPEAGEELTLETGAVITVLKADKRKILTLKIKLPENQDD